MGTEAKDPPTKGETPFSRQVASKAARKLRALQSGQLGVWFGLGMSGLIGWSVAVPTVLGGMLGLWVDRRRPGTHSWTLMLLAAGLVIGCWNAWHWITLEEKSMCDGKDDKDE
jgi:ATP synthase protein I